MAKDSILQNTSERLAQLRAITPTYDEAKENITSGRSGRVLADYFIGLAEGAKDGFLAMVNPMTYKMIVDAVGKGLGEGTAFMMTDSMNKEQKWEVVKQNITIMVEVVTQLGDKFNNLPEDEKGKVVGEIAGIVWGGAKGAQLLGKASSIALKAANKAPVLGATIKAPSLPKMPEIKLSMPEGLSKAFANINENITTWAKANNVEALTNQIKELDAAYKAAQTSGQLGLQESSQYISQFNSLKRNLVAAKLIEGISASMKAALDWAIQKIDNMITSISETGGKVIKNMTDMSRSEILQGGAKLLGKIENSVQSARNSLITINGRNALIGSEGKELVQKISELNSFLKDPEVMKAIYSANRITKEALLQDIENLYTELGKVSITLPSLSNGFQQMRNMFQGLSQKGGELGAWADKVLVTTITAKDNALNAVAQSVGAKPLQMPNIIAPAFGEEIENKPISSRKAEILNTVKGDTLKNITITNYKQGDWKEINFSIAKSLGIPLNKNSEASLIAFGKQVQIAFGYPENTVNGKIGPKTLAAIRKFENLAK